MSEKSATNAAPIWLLKMVKRSLANNDFYANNVAPDLVRNTTLLSGLKPFSKNTFLANRLLNSSQLSMINHLSCSIASCLRVCLPKRYSWKRASDHLVEWYSLLNLAPHCLHKNRCLPDFVLPFLTTRSEPHLLHFF